MDYLLGLGLFFGGCFVGMLGMILFSPSQKPEPEPERAMAPAQPQVIYVPMPPQQPLSPSYFTSTPVPAVPDFPEAVSEKEIAAEEEAETHAEEAQEPAPIEIEESADPLGDDRLTPVEQAAESSRQPVHKKPKRHTPRKDIRGTEPASDAPVAVVAAKSVERAPVRTLGSKPRSGKPDEAPSRNLFEGFESAREVAEAVAEVFDRKAAEAS